MFCLPENMDLRQNMERRDCYIARPESRRDVLL